MLFRSNEWKNKPVIVSENAQEDAINEQAAYAFVHRTNQVLHWYYTIDKHQQNSITDEVLKRHLLNLNSGVTNQHLGKIPLFIGMPVMISLVVKISVLNFSLNLNHLELNLKFSSKFGKFTELNLRSSSEFSLNYFSLN